ncbi:MAG: dTMP kinase [Deltaproteobacteria bacterium]|nr:dTMP kinase [Deltaproteobacteria bacterium]
MGLFITFEGIEGCGKTTQARLLNDHLNAKGVETILIREPGGTALGEKIRGILLTAEGDATTPVAELFLYEACRAQLVNTVIRPALAKGLTVICDRFTDSTTAYQGYARGLDLASIASANAIATGGLRPDITILMDCAPAMGLGRAIKRMEQAGDEREDRFEREAAAFHEKVRAGYLSIARAEPGRVKLVDAGREIPLIHKDICDIINEIIL